MYIGVLPACVSVRVPGPLELELQIVVSCHVGQELKLFPL